VTVTEAKAAVARPATKKESRGVWYSRASQRVSAPYRDRARGLDRNREGEGRLEKTRGKRRKEVEAGAWKEEKNPEREDSTAARQRNEERRFEVRASKRDFGVANRPQNRPHPGGKTGRRPKLGRRKNWSDTWNDQGQL
jgi:hypothetical protein